VIRFSLPVTIVVDAVAWVVIQVGAGYLVHCLPAVRLDQDRWLFRPRRWEDGGAFYARRLRVRRWKGWLPEAGSAFRGGFDKRSLRSTSPEYLAAYVRETKRAELGHWLSLAPTPLFALWNPPLLLVAMIVYALVVNGPCIAAQRYNRLRLQRILRREDAGSSEVS
jgi:glycosyl-4,4'-diaponeurosporenoate acyltransferase